jgi:hypothetical protein
MTMVLAISLTACEQSPPRSLQYFEGHLDDAREVVAACATDTHRGEECQHASMAIETAEAREKFKRFRGK